MIFCSVVCCMAMF